MSACNSGFRNNRIKRKAIPKTTRAAYHEAGHAVMAWLLDITFENVSIMLLNEDDGGYGGCFQLQYGEGKKIDQLDIKEKRTTIENYVIMILAGEISEFLLTRRHNLLDSLSDYFEAYKMTLHHLCISSDKFHPDNRETELYMKWLSERCKIILKTPQNWCAVKTIAHELVKRKVIRGWEAVDIIKNSRLKNDTIQSKKRAHSNLANSTLKPRNILL